jgi:peptide/nickel transport system substrate-binding protein
MRISRRDVLEQGIVAAGLSAAPAIFSGKALAAPVRGGQLIVGQSPDPVMLTSALTVAGPVQVVSGKIFDGLLSYDDKLNPRPQLAQSWSVSSDGLTYTFKLRPGVTWHDGKPFTSADVAFSVLEIWKKFHSRGRATFANVTAVETPDPMTAIWRLSKPAPYILSALASVESQVLPKHLYEGTDVLTNPHNVAPVGTGPFKFQEWKRGQYLALTRNPNYWDKGKPYLDRVIFRILPDAGSAATALETGEIQLVSATSLAYSDLGRLSRLPNVTLFRRNGNYTAGVTGFEFNLDKPYFKDVRVRRAFAHAIDRDALLRTVWFGYGKVATGPVPPSLTQFYTTTDVPAYPFNPELAKQLLDQAGFKPNAAGVRLSITHDPAPVGDAYFRSAEFIRDALGKVGVSVQIRHQDFAGFLRRVYTERDFDTIQFPANASPDPAIGAQRLYWSKNFQKGVAFSNGSHYDSPQADHLLETAQAEVDPAKRRALYAAFQKLAMTDLPRIPLISLDEVVLATKQAHDYITDDTGFYGNLASAFIDQA